VEAEERIMRKLESIVKQTAADRKSDEKVNKVTRQEVTAVAAEVKAIKKKTGKLVTALDSAQGTIKRTSEGLDALNKKLTVDASSSGAATSAVGGAGQTAVVAGSSPLDFFSGEPRQAPWVKSMVVSAQGRPGCCASVCNRGSRYAKVRSMGSLDRDTAPQCTVSLTIIATLGSMVGCSLSSGLFLLWLHF